jgi:hypothetical protein
LYSTNIAPVEDHIVAEFVPWRMFRWRRVLSLAADGPPLYGFLGWPLASREVSPRFFLYWLHNNFSLSRAIYPCWLLAML